MLRLRLDVVSSENLKDICIQAARIATTIGIEVVFELNGNDVVAKPGMNPESLAEIFDYLDTPAIMVGGHPNEPKATEVGNTTHVTGDVSITLTLPPISEDQAPAPEIVIPDVQKEGI